MYTDDKGVWQSEFLYSKLADSVNKDSKPETLIT